MKCTGKTQDLQPCRGHALSGSKYCYFHDPGSVEHRREAQSKGGSNRSHLAVIPAPPFDIDLEDPSKIAKLLTHIANGIVRGEVDTKVGYAIVNLADCAMRAHQASALAGRIAEVERLQSIERVAPVHTLIDTPIQLEDDADELTESENV